MWLGLLGSIHAAQKMRTIEPLNDSMKQNIFLLYRYNAMNVCNNGTIKKYLREQLGGMNILQPLACRGSWRFLLPLVSLQPI